MALLVEAVGYAARVVAHYRSHDTVPYAVQSLLILLGLILFAASIYMILGRIIRATNGERYSFIPIKWLTKIFVGGDVTCFLIQGGGGGILSSAKSQKDVNLGESVILAGLIFQIIVFAVFVVASGTYHYKIRQASATRPLSSATPLDRYMIMLYSVSLLIALRNIFRAIEYATGSDGYILTHEWTLYVFDAALMAVVMAVCVAWYGSEIQNPSRLSSGDGEATEELTRFK